MSNRLPGWLPCRAISPAAAIFLCASCAAAPVDRVLVAVESGAHATCPQIGYRVIGDAEAFRQLYAALHAQSLPAPTPPAIDFSRHIVIAACLGARSSTGYGISFGASAAIDGSVATVRVIERRPSSGAVVGPAMTHPYAIAALPRSAFDAVLFVDAAGTELAFGRLR